MLKLNPEKENLLESEYGFSVSSPNTHFKTYKFAGIIICPINNPKFSGNVTLHSFGRAVQDKLYELIKNDVLIQVPDKTREERISKMKIKIENLEKQIKELEDTE